MAIPMRGGFSGYVPLNPASNAVAERNMMTGDMRAINGRPVAVPGSEQAPLGALGEDYAPVPRPAAAAATSKSRRRAKIADSVQGVPYQDITNQRGPASWWQVASNVIGSDRGFMPAFAKSVDARRDREAQDAATAAYDRYVSGGGGNVGQLIGDPDLNEGQRAYLASTIKDQKPFAVGKNVYDPNTGQFITPTGPGGAGLPDIDDWNKMQKAYEGSPGVERFRKVQPTLAAMQASINDDTAMSDLQFVYGLASILDPQSAVKEGEMGLVISSQSIPSALLGQLNKMIEGKGGMRPGVRQQLYQVARKRAEAYMKQAQSELQYFQKTGQPYGITPQMFRPLDALPGEVVAPSDAQLEEPTDAEIEAELRKRGVIR